MLRVHGDMKGCFGYVFILLKVFIFTVVNIFMTKSQLIIYILNDTYWWKPNFPNFRWLQSSKLYRLFSIRYTNNPHFEKKKQNIPLSVLSDPKMYWPHCIFFCQYRLLLHFSHVKFCSILDTFRDLILTHFLMCISFSFLIENYSADLSFFVKIEKLTASTN